MSGFLKGFRKRFPHYRQLDAMDCGPTCLRMIAKHYGREYSLERLRELSHISRQGVSMLGISEAARAIGMETVAAKMTTDQLAERVPLPCILHWQQRHFVVLYGITERGGRRRYKIADPATKKLSYSEEEMRRLWVSTREGDKE
ncbi:MAG: peptidase domain-containing ABC transporter, partial [Paramuribaculum sp.]|nr:peptidase domain-containing ABC transporter [Paramuribaculum sp.]